MARQILALLAALFAATSPATAALPEAAKQMIDAAAREGNPAELAAVVKFARRSYPDDTVEIDTLLLSLESQRQPVETPKIVVAPPPPLAPAATPKPAIKWSGRGDLGGFHTSGNTDSFGITVGANVKYAGPALTHQIRLRGDYQESEGRTSREYLNAAYQADWAVSDRYYALGILEYERDVLAGFDHRATSSLGLGWRVVREEAVAISLEAGPAFRREWYRFGGQRSHIASRSALTSSWQMNDKVRLTQNMELVAENQNNTVRAITGLQAKLTSRISSQISYDLRYQDRPLFGKEETDTITRIGLTYDF
jgi:putative salt-induced outer membrane protein